MYEVMFALHVLSAVAVGFYLLMPFLTMNIAGMPQDRLSGYTGPLAAMNRIGQFVLVITLVTGGAMLHDAPVSMAWGTVAVILILIIFALSGMMSKPLRQLASGDVRDAAGLSGKLRSLSILNAVALLLIVLLMLNPEFLR